MPLACTPVIEQLGMLVTSTFLLVLLGVGVIAGSRCIRARIGDTRRPGLTSLGVFLAASKATLGALVACLVPGALDAPRALGAPELLPPGLVFFGSAWLGIFLVLLGVEARGSSREAPVLPVVRDMALVVAAHTVSGFALGLPFRCPLEGAIAGTIAGVVSALLAALIAGWRSVIEVPRRPAPSVEMGRTLGALPGTILRGAPAALAGAALGLAPAGLCLVLLLELPARVVDAALGGFVTFALLAGLALFLAPAHALALIAFTKAARGDRPALLPEPRRALAVTARIAPFTFVLLAAPLAWHVVVVVTGFRFFEGASLASLGLFVGPVLAISTRYALVGPALATGEDFEIALWSARALSLGRRAVLAAAASVPVLALAFSPVHGSILRPSVVAELRWRLWSAPSDAAAWLSLGRVLAHELAQHPAVLAFELGRLALVLLLGSAIAAALHATVSARPRPAWPWPAREGAPPSSARGRTRQSLQAGNAPSVTGFAGALSPPKRR
jgi:hypothetical protein